MFDLNYNIFKNPTKSTNTITRFYAGPSSISKNGENREVKDIIPSNIPDDLVKFIGALVI